MALSRLGIKSSEDSSNRSKGISTNTAQSDTPVPLMLSRNHCDILINMNTGITNSFQLYCLTFGLKVAAIPCGKTKEKSARVQILCLSRSPYMGFWLELLRLRAKLLVCLYCTKPSDKQISLDDNDKIISNNDERNYLEINATSRIPFEHAYKIDSVWWLFLC